MLIKELFSPLNEFDSKHHRELVDHIMTANGYKKLGHGTDAVVYEKDAGSVIKVLIPESGDLRGANEGLEEFLNFCKAHPGNPHLPKFVEGKTTVAVEGEEFHQVVMEKLLPVTDQFTRGILDSFAGWDESSSFYAQYPSWSQAFKVLQDWKNSPESAEELGELKWPADAQFNKKFGKFYETAAELYSINQGLWDLHKDNVMQRANGTLVIVDPWFYSYV